MIRAPELDLIEILSRQAVKEYMELRAFNSAEDRDRQAKSPIGAASGNIVQIGSLPGRKNKRSVTAS